MEEEWVAQDTPLVVCAYGWSQTFRLYRNRLDVDGKCYDLKELAHVNLVHNRVLGIPSARLELRFARKRLVLRGIAAIAEAQKAADYLKTWFEDSEQATDYSAAAYRVAADPGGPGVSPLLDGVGVDPVSRPGMPGGGSGVSPLPTDPGGSGMSDGDSGVSPLPDREGVVFGGGPDISTEDNFPLQQWEHARIVIPSAIIEDDLYEDESSQTSADLYMDADRFEMIKTKVNLPVVRVPVRLLPGEHAHYSTNATFCDERTSEQYSRKHDARHYPARDHGMLILTNRRMVFMGRNNQIVLDYNYLLHFSRLRNAVSFQADHWQKRIIFTVPQPIECALYMEAILQRFQQSVSYSEQLL